MDFASQLLAERKRLGLRQPEVAAALELPDRTYWEYENGKTVPHAIAQEGALTRLAKLKPKKP